jgi:GntR family transcriptional regulator, transcriptional repressor for pyruvate dehydrogenase complex
MQIEKIKQKTVVEQVMEKIKHLIADGQFKVGDKIPTEHELAEMFGIGRSSIREAIKIFNYLGILESQTSKGTYVCDRTTISAEAFTWAVLLGKDEIYDLMEVRGALEQWSLVSLTEKFKANPNEIESVLNTLKDEVEKMKNAVRTGQKNKLIEADYNFHRAIIVGYANSIFIASYEILKSFMYEEIERAHRSRSDHTDTVQDHEKIIKGIESGNIIQSLQIYRTHIETTKEQVRATLNRM